MSCCKPHHVFLLNPQVKNLTLSSAFRLCNSVVGPWGICEKTQFLLSGCLSPSMWCPEQININVIVPQALLGTCSLWEAPQYSDDPHFWLPPINRSCFFVVICYFCKASSAGCAPSVGVQDSLEHWLHSSHQFPFIFVGNTWKFSS